MNTKRILKNIASLQRHLDLALGQLSTLKTQVENEMAAKAAIGNASTSAKPAKVKAVAKPVAAKTAKTAAAVKKVTSKVTSVGAKPAKAKRTAASSVKQPAVNK